MFNFFTGNREIEKNTKLQKELEQESTKNNTLQKKNKELVCSIEHLKTENQTLQQKIENLKLFDNNKIFKMVDVEEVCEIEPFEEQRDLDKNRLPDIITVFTEKLKKTDRTSFDFECPLIFLKCKNNDNFLLNKKQKRCNEVVVDGQHRIAALRYYIEKRPKYGSLKVPVIYHMVENLQMARVIQYNLFQQKPVADYDKIRKNNYDLADVIAKCNRLLSKKYPMLARKKFRDGSYSDRNKRYRKYHFLWGEFEKCIKNSCVITNWVQREIKAEELVDSFGQLIAECIEQFCTLNEKQQMKFVNIPVKRNFDLFLQFTEKQKLKFDFISYHYYKNYSGMIKDLECILEITGSEESEESEESDEESD